ncbi:hypothetical protein [Aeromonas caviae]|uniref:Uncharacterized protein n=1 Tax=Aeromonas caviae TaxID=648 RepID=A0AAJ6CT35_AERCA|nr:hypothetical protein [Aeromonas caviae]RWT81283.1 hypothetical protein DN604_00505 [Aeromonas caviae]WFG00130.1 hypothetical protein P5S46_21785 [Aeromonas caviae]
MGESVDIQNPQIARALHQSIEERFYREQLIGLQAEANNLGYFFSKSDTMVAPSSIATPMLIDRFSRAIMHKRVSFMTPNRSESWETDVDGSMRDGYAETLCHEILGALSQQGISLQAGLNAKTFAAIDPLRELTSPLEELSAPGHGEGAGSAQPDNGAPEHAFNIATPLIANLVSQHINSIYWAHLIDALQNEARACGYEIAKTETEIDIPRNMVERMGSAITLCRRRFLYPNDSSSWVSDNDSDTESGFSSVFYHEMITSLAALGYRLQDTTQRKNAVDA